MNDMSTETRSVIVERAIAHPPEKVWRALTQPHLIEEWLMKTDFKPAVGQDFTLGGDWGTVECRVLEVEPHRALSYTWQAFGMESVVTWTLTATDTGTHLRMEQAGFQAGAGFDRFYQGAQASWPQFLDKLDDVLARLD